MRNSTFEDCWRGIEFLDYVRYSGTTPVKNAGFVNNCDFITTTAFGDNSNIRFPYAFITNYKTFNISMQGNRFVNNNTSVPYYRRGVGIITMDAQVFVQPLCTVPTLPGGTCTNTVASEFHNLFCGVNVLQGATNFKVNVDRNIFTNNLTGIRVEGAHFGSFSSNTFNIPVPSGYNAPKDATGIYCASTWGVKIEDNTFNNLGGTGTGRTNGIIVADSDIGGGGLNVYRNNYNNLTTGTETIGLNVDLQIDCNNYNKSIVYSVSDIFHADGVLADQGISCVTASNNNTPNLTQKNQFTGDPCNGTDNFQLYKNTGAASFAYNNYGPSTGFNVACISPLISGTDCNFGGTPQCPSRLVDKTNYFTLKNILSDEIADLKEEILDLKSRIDGGNTQEVLDFLANTSDPELIKNYLLTRSPYLSDDVLIAAISKNLPHGILKQILISNSSLSEKVLSVLESYFLPNGTRKQIYAIQDGTGSMRDLVRSINYLENSTLLSVNELVSLYLDSGYVDSAIVVLKNENNLNALCALVPIFIGRDISSADTTLTKLEQFASAELQSDPQCKTCEKILSYCGYQRELLTITNQSGGYFTITENQKFTLKEIAESETALAISAQSILNFLNTTSRHLDGFDYLMPDGSVRKHIADNTIKISEQHKVMNIYPNPAANTITISISGDTIEGKIYVYDIYGRIIISKVVTNNYSSIDVSGFPQGIYTVLYISNNESLTQKVVIQR